MNDQNVRIRQRVRMRLYRPRGDSEPGEFKVGRHLYKVCNFQASNIYYIQTDAGENLTNFYFIQKNKKTKRALQGSKLKIEWNARHSVHQVSFKTKMNLNEAKKQIFYLYKHERGQYKRHDIEWVNQGDENNPETFTIVSGIKARSGRLNKKSRSKTRQRRRSALQPLNQQRAFGQTASGISSQNPREQHPLAATQGSGSSSSIVQPQSAENLQYDSASEQPLGQHALRDSEEDFDEPPLLDGDKSSGTASNDGLGQPADPGDFALEDFVFDNHDAEEYNDESFYTTGVQPKQATGDLKWEWWQLAVVVLLLAFHFNSLEFQAFYSTGHLPKCSAKPRLLIDTIPRLPCIPRRPVPVYATNTGNKGVAATQLLGGLLVGTLAGVGNQIYWAFIIDPADLVPSIARL